MQAAGIAPLAHNVPNCRTVRKLSGPQQRVAVNIVWEFFACDSQPWKQAPGPSDHR